MNLILFRLDLDLNIFSYKVFWFTRIILVLFYVMTVCVVIENADETVQLPGLLIRKSKLWIRMSASSIILADIISFTNN